MLLLASNRNFHTASSSQFQVCQDSVVIITIHYKLDGSGFEIQWVRDFSHPSRKFLGSTPFPVQWVLVLSQVYSGLSVALTIHPHIVLRSKREHRYTSTPHLRLQGMLQDEPYFFIFFNFRKQSMYV
jgi:hypothetical protein